MKYYLLYILFASTLVPACQEEGGYANEISFQIINQTTSDITGTLYAVQDTVPLDSIAFAVEANNTQTVSWTDFAASGEGDFQVYLSDEHQQRFGYFTNGVSTRPSFSITVQTDTLIIN